MVVGIARGGFLRAHLVVPVTTIGNASSDRRRNFAQTGGLASKALHKFDESASHQFSPFSSTTTTTNHSPFTSQVPGQLLRYCSNVHPTFHGAPTYHACPLVFPRSSPSSRHRPPPVISREPHATLSPISKVRIARMAEV